MWVVCTWCCMYMMLYVQLYMLYVHDVVCTWCYMYMMLYVHDAICSCCMYMMLYVQLYMMYVHDAICTWCCMHMILLQVQELEDEVKKAPPTYRSHMFSQIRQHKRELEQIQKDSVSIVTDICVVHTRVISRSRIHVVQLSLPTRR